MGRTLILASQSPRRAALVRLLGIRDIQIRPADLDEVFDPERIASENVRLISLHKARHIAEQTDGNSVILGADTTVVLDGEVLNKPVDPADAVRMLQLLSGQTHTVYTGVALVDAHTKGEDSFVVSTDVTFRPLSDEEIRSYVASGSPMDKAGAYGIQEDFGAVFVRHIDGDYYNVVGLPLCRLYVALRQFAPDLFVAEQFA